MTASLKPWMNRKMLTTLTPDALPFRALHVPEPPLVFGYGQSDEYTRRGLYLYGPLDSDEAQGPIRYGFVGAPEGLILLRRWSATMQRFTPAYYQDGSPSRHPIPFPGFQAAYRAPWPMEPVATCLLDRTQILDAIYTGRRHEAVKKTVDLFVEAVLTHLRRDEKRPPFWFVIVPDEVHEYGRPNSSIPTQLRRTGSVTISRRRAARLHEAPDLFEDFNAQAHVFEYHNDFRRQLKARLIKERVAVQIVRESTFSRVDRQLEDEATIAWKLSNAIFYKSEQLPWRLESVRGGVCYVGLVFKRLQIGFQKGNACCAAQMFLSSGEGVVFKGAVGPWYSTDKKEFHLPQTEARALLELVLDEYRRKHNNSDPNELFLHSTFRFDEAEWNGFESACPENTELCAIRIVDGHRDLKLYRAGNYPVLRGTAVKLSPRSGLLWTTGYVPDLRTYPGMETPNPIHIEVSRGDIDLDVVFNDIMGLTKLNFNSCHFADRLPVTIRFANAIGDILTAVSQDSIPPLPFYYYI
jgi:hypothetical protein